MSSSFADLFEQSIKNLEMRTGAVVTGLVVSIDKDFVVVDAGLKSEARIPIAQFRELDGTLSVSVGSSVDVAVDTLEDSTGETRLSREKAKRMETWKRLESALTNNELVTGTITNEVKGGFTVDMGDGIRAFLPRSLLDVRPVRDLLNVLGKEVEFKLVKLDPRRNNIVVSRRAVIEQSHSAERAELMNNLQEGQIVVGAVKNLTDYGVFVDLGGIDGLLHITDMNWKRIKHPSEMVSVGQEITVKILRFDRERSRVSLGVKQLGDDPWVNITQSYPVGKRIRGEVSNIADYGCFVDLGGGIEGLVHVSEMDWTNRNVNPQKLVQIGQPVEVVILDIDEERRRISLGLKQCIENPWKKFAGKFSKGDKVIGKIKSITDFGVFVGLEGDIDGLIHVSDISWDRPSEEVIREFKKGDEVQAMVLGVDVERERISLGLKQLISDQLGEYLNNHPKGSFVTGTVLEIAEECLIDLGSEIKGLIRGTDLSKSSGQESKSVKVGDTIEAQVMGLDRKRKLVLLSIKAMESSIEKQAAKEYRNKNEERSGNMTLGDLIKEQMDSKSE